MKRCSLTGPALEALYARYNRREFVDPDPLIFLYRYPDPGDREIVALIASSLAFGRVAQILRSVERVLAALGPQPRRVVLSAAPAAQRKTFAAFRHRYAAGRDVAALLTGVRHALERHGSLNECFVSRLDPEDRTVLPALAHFAAALGGEGNCLVASPAKGSACKRLHLFLRWMVRQDEVDPGGWRGIRPDQLVVPLDTHMTAIAKRFGLTRRRSPGGRMAVEITDRFRRWAPDDPVKYDFALTRFGIRSDLDIGMLA